MAFVKGFDINGINTTQTACIELQGRPNAATEGAVGLLGIDVTSPTKDVYKCVAVNGAVYTWELLSSGMSILASNNTTSGTSKRVLFPHDQVQTPDNYVVKVGDLIIDATGYIYRVFEIQPYHYLTEYTGVYVNRDGVGISSVEQEVISDESGSATQVTIKLTNGKTYSFEVKNGQTAYQLAVAKGYKGTEEEWLDNIGYDSWLKGKAVTQDEYDAMPDNEKYQSGFMYVIKDAEINVNTADKANTANTASTLSLEKVHEGNCYGGATHTGASLSDGVYMVHWKTDEGYISGDGLLYLDNTTFHHNCGSYVDNTNTIYACEATLTHNGHYGFRIIKHSGTITTEHSYVGGTISVYKIK